MFEKVNRGLNEMVAPEPWATRWYTPLLILGAALLALVIVALAVVEVLIASAPETVTPREWTAPLDRADEALQDGDIAAALVWWREARISATRSGRWDSMIELGDASRRLGAYGGFRRDGDANARQAYLTALFRARRQHSLDGMLRAAAAFGEMGDRDVLAQALRVAAHEARHDAVARERVRAVSDYWTNTPLDSERREAVPGGRQ